MTSDVDMELTPEEQNARTDCIGLNFWNEIDHGCENTARREPELKLRERMCKFKVDEDRGYADEWCGMYDGNGTVFPEFADCLTPEGKMNTKCKLMCSGRPSQPGCEWYAEIADKEAAEKAARLAMAKAAAEAVEVRNKCIGMQMYQLADPGCENTARKNPELKLRERVCKFVSRDVETANDWCGMYDSNDVVFPEFVKCLTSIGQKNPECRLMCTGRPSQKGCEWYVEEVAADEAAKAKAVADAAAKAKAMADAAAKAKAVADAAAKAKITIPGQILKIVKPGTIQFRYTSPNNKSFVLTKSIPGVYKVNGTVSVVVSGKAPYDFIGLKK
jgi:hypothetical protein